MKTITNGRYVASIVGKAWEQVLKNYTCDELYERSDGVLVLMKHKIYSFMIAVRDESVSTSWLEVFEGELNGKTWNLIGTKMLDDSPFKTSYLYTSRQLKRKYTCDYVLHTESQFNKYWWDKFTKLSCPVKLEKPYVGCVLINNAVTSYHTYS